jgi:hypothetical protein
MAVDELGLVGREPRFCHGIVPALAGSGQALDYPRALSRLVNSALVY